MLAIPITEQDRGGLGVRLTALRDHQLVDLSRSEITGKVAGTSKGGVLDLEFPYLMTERNCEGTVKMNIKMPQKPGRAAGTMEAVGCGRDPSQKLTGTVELVPSAPAKK